MNNSNGKSKGKGKGKGKSIAAIMLEQSLRDELVFAVSKQIADVMFTTIQLVAKNGAESEIERAEKAVASGAADLPGYLFDLLRAEGKSLEAAKLEGKEPLEWAIQSVDYIAATIANGVGGEPLQRVPEYYHLIDEAASALIADGKAMLAELESEIFSDAARGFVAPVAAGKLN